MELERRLFVLLVIFCGVSSEGQWRPFWSRRALFQSSPNNGDDNFLTKLHAVVSPFLFQESVSSAIDLPQPVTEVETGGGNAFLSSDEMTSNIFREKNELAMALQANPRVPVPSNFLKEANDDEIARFLNLLTLVRFPNAPCETFSSGLRGLCYPESECLQLGGEPYKDEPCAAGFGSCCVFRVTCGGVARINGTYFESPGFPLGVIAGTQPESCFVKIERSHPLVTQVRIDLEVFELSAPNKGECDRDQMVVSGQDASSPIPPLCGVNTGQHVYVEMGSKQGQGPVQVSIVLSGPTIGPITARRWRLRFTQLTPRDEPLAAPSHCLQYHTEPTGIVQSFNYVGTTGYMNDLNYAICIRKMSGSCSVTYRNYSYNGTQFRFQLVNYDGGQSIVPPNQAGAGVFNCPDDYIVVSGVRLCGEKLNDATRNIDFTVNAPVTDSSSGPFILPVRTNGALTGQGFNLSYTQNACQ